MANEVFANGLELACKAGDGKSPACFPDVCFSPPSPPAGWIPIPYANTAYAKDTANASKTVFISGKPVMKKDVSYFKTSTGNEPAAGPKGIVTGVKKGKAYFTSWSMNVKIEGQNVDRHTDSMTHNHGSTGNTGPWAFLDTATKKDCATEIKRMKNACEKKQKEKKKIRGRMREVDSDKAAPLYKQRSGDWRKHCKGLDILPKELSKEDFEVMKSRAAKKLKSFDIIEKALDKMIDEITDKAVNKISLIAAKTAAKAGLKGWLGPIGWAWTAYDVYDGIKTANQLRQFIQDIKKEVTDLKNFTKKFSELSADEPDKNMAEIMKNIGKFNSCIRARKCQLVKYTSSQGIKRTNVGCCNGQTGHHMIPNSFYFKGSVEDGKKIDDCKKYKEGKAPVVCAEGTGNTHGSHGDLHSSFQKHADKEKDGDEIEYKDARNAAILAHKKVFGISQCSTKCLKSQLDNYRKKACKGSNPDLTHKQIVRSDEVER